MDSGPVHLRVDEETEIIKQIQQLIKESTMSKKWNQLKEAIQSRGQGAARRLKEAARPAMPPVIVGFAMALLRYIGFFDFFFGWVTAIIVSLAIILYGKLPEAQ
jgi:hypothetical protein